MSAPIKNVSSNRRNSITVTAMPVSSTIVQRLIAERLCVVEPEDRIDSRCYPATGTPHKLEIIITRETMDKLTDSLKYLSKDSIATMSDAFTIGKTYLLKDWMLTNSGEFSSAVNLLFIEYKFDLAIKDCMLTLMKETLNVYMMLCQESGEVSSSYIGTVAELNGKFYD